MPEHPQPEKLKISIEPAHPGDARELEELKLENITDRVAKGELEELKFEVSEGGISAVRQRIEKSDANVYFVARHEGRILGMCLMVWQPSEDKFQFRQFYVRPEYSGRGIGKALWEQAMAHARTLKEKPKPVYLWTLNNNEKAQKTYRGWGMKSTGETMLADDGFTYVKFVPEIEENKA